MASSKHSYKSHTSPPSDRGVRAKKHLGQHFLKDEPTAQKIADTLSLQGYSNVLEIGPGTGVLTKYLITKPVNILAMDVDKESIDFLEENLKMPYDVLGNHEGDFTIEYADFLKENLDPLFGGEPFAITGNFPYNISSQIVFKALDYKDRIPEFTGMFQKEVAERICEKPGSKAYGILSVLVQAYYHAEYLFTVPPTVFNPPPKVDSGVLRLRRKDNLDLGCNDALFKRVVKTAFNQRRKTLRNSLKSMIHSENLKEDAIFDKRPETLGVDEFVSLTKKLSDDTI
jgi:16S rRNA (adenine1518-N6/adenine1519-N6)-dimethyltransferase